MTSQRRRLSVSVLLAVLTLAGASGEGSAQAETDGARSSRLQTAIDNLVAHPNGPPGAIVLVQRGSNLTVYRAGAANPESGTRLRLGSHMRIASTAKAYSGGVALRLVEKGVLSLRDTVGERLPWAPRSWRRVTLGQALHHTSGLPDFSADEGFLDYLRAHLEEAPKPRRLLGFVADRDLRFDPGTKYRYSNSDNIVVGLMVEDATGRRYERVLADEVFEPLGLRSSSLPRGVQMRRPVLHGFDRADDGTLVDVTRLVAAGYAWASGGIVSTPADQNRFIRGYIGRDLFGKKAQRVQFDFRAGHSEPPGPGKNAAGLAVFRYRTGCGTMFGHTGNTPGYTQFIAASRDGRRSVVVSVNRQTTPTVAPGVFRKLRNTFRLAVCAANQN
jgi:D-alanyl-D-alanine carboxypeptidase